MVHDFFSGISLFGSQEINMYVFSQDTITFRQPIFKANGITEGYRLHSMAFCDINLYSVNWHLQVGKNMNQAEKKQQWI